MINFIKSKFFHSISLCASRLSQIAWCGECTTKRSRV